MLNAENRGRSTLWELIDANLRLRAADHGVGIALANSSGRYCPQPASIARPDGSARYAPRHVTGFVLDAHPFEALGWTPPSGARAVACDFEHTRVSEALAQSDFDPSAPALVSWLGVTYYLTPDAAAASLADLGALLASGSEVVMDTMRPWEELPEAIRRLEDD